MTNLYNKTHYLDQRLKNFNIDPKYLTKSMFLKDLDNKVINYTVEHFARHGEDVRINYHDLKGHPFTFNRKRTSSLHASGHFTENFHRLRLSPTKCANGSPKYIQPKHTRVLPYLNGLLDFYGDELHSIQTVYLTEGEFKAFVGCMHDVPTIGAGGIHSFSVNHKNKWGQTVRNEFLPEIVEALDQLPNLENIVLLHDSDANEGTDERRNNFFLSVKYFNYCVKEYNILRGKKGKGFISSEYWVGRSKEFKGLDDLLTGSLYALDDFQSGFSEFHYKHTLYSVGDNAKVVNERLEFLKLWFNLNNKPFRTEFVATVLNIQKRVNESKTELKRLVNENKRLLIQAPTGSGKTYTFLKEILPARLTANPYERIAFVVPTKALAEEISGAYDLPLVHGEIKDDERLVAFHSRLFVTTLDSAPSMGLVDTLVIDEAHTLTRDFRQKAKQGVEDLMNMSERTIMLTATPSALWKHFGYTLVKIQQDQPKERNITVNALDEKTALRKVLAELVFKASKQPAEKVTFIRMNSKTNLRNALDEAVSSGLFQKDEIAYIDSNDENKGKVYESIVSNSMVPPGIRLVAMTSLMDEGVNINNTNIADVHFIQDKIAGDLRDEQAVQFISRFRKWDGAPNLYIKRDDRDDSNTWNPDVYFEQQLKASKDELTAMQFRGEDQTKGENLIRTHSERGLLQWSEMRGSWMVSQNGIITDTLQFFARRLPLSEYVKQLNSYDGFNAVVVDYVSEDEAEQFIESFNSLGRVNLAKRKRLRSQFDRIFKENPEGIISAFYRFYGRPFDKKTIREMWPEVESWTPSNVDELEKINEVHTVYSYLYDVAKLNKTGLKLNEAVALWLQWNGTRAFKMMCAAFEFWGVMSNYKKGRRISSRDRQLAERIDSVRVFLVEMYHKEQTYSLRDIKQHLHKRGVRVRLDDLKLWVDILVDVSETTVKGTRRLKVVQVYGLDQYYDRFNGVQKVGNFFTAQPRNATPKKASQRAEKQTFTSKRKNPIRSLARVQIGIKNEAKNNPEQRQKPTGKPNETNEAKND